MSPAAVVGSVMLKLVVVVVNPSALAIKVIAIGALSDIARRERRSRLGASRNYLIRRLPVRKDHSSLVIE